MLNPQLLDRLLSPAGNELEFSNGELRDRTLGQVFPIQEGVAVFRTPPVASGFDYTAHYETDAIEFDYFEERRGETEHEERRVRDFLISLVPKDTVSILDAGCGSAWVAKEFLPRGKFVTSMDVSTANPREALRRYPADHHAGLVADAFQLPLKPGSFDVVIASEIIEHVVDPKAFVHSLLRVVRPGGKLLISTPYKEVLRYSLCVHCNQKTPQYAHLHSFDEHKLRSYAPEGVTAQHYVFGNKALFHLRTHFLLGRLPFSLWVLIDRLANRFLPKMGHIVVSYEKRS